MTLVPLLLVALGVSADAFAVALGKGLHMRRLDLGQALLIAFSFAVFQAGMPVIGWLLGTKLAPYITAIDHWVAFGLLLLIGGKMLWEAFRPGEDTDADSDRIGARELLVLSVATSVDALAVGISFAFLPISIGPAVALIGVTTLVLSFVGVLLGHRAGNRFRGPAEIAGGLILIAIGASILYEHLSA